MPLVNWPPASSPVWPPPEITVGWLSFAGIKTLLLVMRDEYHFTQAAPTPAERTTYFNSARCDEGHQVIGRMIVSPDGLRRYPFAVCNNSTHRQLLVLWPGYCMDIGSGIE